MSNELEGKWKELFVTLFQLSLVRLSVRGTKWTPLGLDIMQPRQIADRAE